jgi:hypothetical protein
VRCLSSVELYWIGSPSRPQGVALATTLASVKRRPPRVNPGCGYRRRSHRQVGNAGSGEGNGSQPSRGRGMASGELECKRNNARSTGNHLMLQKMGCINRFDATERLIASSAFEVPPGPCSSALGDRPGRQRATHAGYWELDWSRAQDLEARGASASGCIELRNDDRLAADGLATSGRLLAIRPGRALLIHRLRE